MSKPTTVPLPVLLILLDYWPLARLSRRSLLEKIPFLILSAAFALITVVSQDRTSVATMPTEYPAGRIPLVLCHNIVFYPAKMLFPANLSAHYAFPDPLDFSNPGVLRGVIGTSILLPALCLSLRWTRALLTGWLIFFTAILPTMQIIGFSDVIASDKYAYLPSVGFLLTASWAVGGLWAWAASRDAQSSPALRRIVLTVLFVVLAAAETVATHRYYRVWKDSETLYSYMLSRTPTSAPLHNNLAVALLGEGRYEEAIRHYEQALRLKPGTDETFTNIGVALVRLGKVDEALRLYRQVLRDMPRSYSVHCNLGALLAERGQVDEAVAHYQAAIRLKPGRPEPHNNLGNVLLAKGLIDEAIESFRKAVALRPTMPETQNNLGIALVRKGALAEAEACFSAAIKHRPDYAEAHVNLGLVQAQQGRLLEAIEAARRAVRLAPANIEARFLLGQLLRDTGQREEAVAEFREVLRLDPNHTQAENELKTALGG